MGAGASVATLIVIRPGIEVKAIKGNALGADAHLNETRAHLGVEPVAVHAEVERCIPKADEPGQTPRALHGGLDSNNKSSMALEAREEKGE